MKPIIIASLLSLGFLNAQTITADRVKEEFKNSLARLESQSEEAKKKPSANHDAINEKLLVERKKLADKGIAVLKSEIEKARKAGNLELEESLKETALETFEVDLGNILVGGKDIKVNATGTTKIGTFVEGDKIELQYVSGEWTVLAYAPKRHNPDTTDDGNCNLALVHISISGEITYIDKNIKHTTSKPYEHVVQKRGGYFLKISQTVGNKHDGEAIYHIVITRK
jgi:hypothetical protein